MGLPLLSGVFQRRVKERLLSCFSLFNMTGAAGGNAGKERVQSIETLQSGQKVLRNESAIEATN